MFKYINKLKKKLIITIVPMLLLLLGLLLFEIRSNEPTASLKKFKIDEVFNSYNINIEDTTYYPKFEETGIVDNKKYLFVVNNTCEIIRVDKATMNKITIVRLPKQNKCGGAHISLSIDKIYIEYAGAIYISDFEGSNITKIVDKDKMQKGLFSLIKDSTFTSDDYLISDIYYYKGSIYLFLSTFDIVKVCLDKNNRILRVAKNAETVCFLKDEMIYTSLDRKKMYAYDLKNETSRKILGIDKKKQVQFHTVLEVLDCLYYVVEEKGRKMVVYKYPQQEKIFQFMNMEYSSAVVNNNSSKIICEFNNYGSNNQPAQIVQMFDVIKHVYSTKNMPLDYETNAFIYNDTLFYIKKSSQNNSLGYYSFDMGK